MHKLKSVFSMFGYVFLFLFAIILIVLLVKDQHCWWWHDRNISDEEFIHAVIPTVKAYYNRDITKIRKIMKEKGLPTDEASILAYRQEYHSSFFGKDWHGQLPDFNDPACCRVSRRPTQYFWLHQLLGVQEVAVVIGDKKSWHGYFYFDVCGNLWDSVIGRKKKKKLPISVEKIGGDNDL